MKNLLTNKLKKIILNGVDISNDRIKRRLDIFWIKDAINKDSESHIFQSPTDRHKAEENLQQLESKYKYLPHYYYEAIKI